ncbi:MAG TPA: TerC family protein [Candidatus Synoicihabitans sp.]|nr:TerC family protein [Candidatus Synoicihabitans sp.]
MDTLPLWAWGGFLVFIAAMLALDLGVFHRGAHTVKMKEALSWVAVWVSLALIFNLVVWRTMGGKTGLEWLTGYVVEMALSVDNVFVFIVIFSFFRVPPQHQHRVLFWGIVGAAIMRLVFIFAGVSLLERFHWLIYVFGAFLVFTGIKMALPQKEEVDPDKNIAVRLFRRFYPVSNRYDEGRFFTIENGRRMATPLFIVLLVIETTDVAFALDSIPAVLAITKNPFIVFTSNIFAILGLRSLYFAVHGVMGLFRFLSVGLAVILVFIGVKMLLSGVYHIPIGVSLGVIGATLAVSVVASLLFAKKTVGEPTSGE